MVRALFAPWKERALKDETGMDESKIKEFRSKAEALEKSMRDRKHAHGLKIHTQPIGGYPPKYLVRITDPSRSTLDDPVIVSAAELDRVLPELIAAKRDSIFEDAVIALFGLHLECHDLLADSGKLDLTTQVSNLRGYSRSDRKAEQRETQIARERGEEVTGLSAFSKPPKREEESTTADEDGPEDEP
jgi:hypothetical protein